MNISSAQLFENLGLEVSAGHFDKTYKYFGLGIEGHYQLPYARIKVGYFRNLFSPSAENVVFHSFSDDSFNVPGVEFPIEKYLWKYSVVNFSATSDFQLRDFILTIGGGGIWHTRGDFNTYSYSLISGTEKNYVDRRQTWGYELEAGYKYKKASFSIRIQKPVDIYSFRWNYTFGWEKNNSSIQLLKKRKEKNAPWLYVFFRPRYEVPISKKRNGAVTNFEFGAQVRLTDKYHIFGTFDFGRTLHGSDATDIPYYITGGGTLNVPFTIHQLHLLGSVRNHSLGILRTHQKSSIVGYDYGLGLSLHHFKGTVENWEDGGFDQNMIEKFIGGITAKTQLRIGPFTNGIEFNFPLRKLPPTLSVYWAVGINVRQKQQ